MTDLAPVLPADAILVHIGPHKTGTTAIQSILADSRADLLEHGVLHPGLPKQRHHRAAKSLRGLADGWADDASPVPDPQVWAELAAQSRAAQGRVVLSSEFFAQADAVTRRRLVDDLGADRVQILLAARNPASLAVSTWQQVLRQGHPVTLETWLERFFRRGAALSSFWAWADPVHLTEAWADTVGADRVTVLVLDESDRQLVPSTFEQLLDLPAGLLAGRKPSDSNRGLSGTEAALLLEIIERLQSKLTWKEYSRVMRAGITRRLLEVRHPGPDEPKHALPSWAAEQAVAEAEASIQGLGASKARIVGRLESLRGDAVPEIADQEITHVPIELAAEAAIGGIAGALRRRWYLEDLVETPAAPQKQARPHEPTVSTTSTGQLIKIVGVRIRDGVKRRVRPRSKGR